MLKVKMSAMNRGSSVDFECLTSYCLALTNAKFMGVRWRGFGGGEVLDPPNDWVRAQI